MGNSSGPTSSTLSEPPARPADPPIVPLCSGCGYDLRGIPDGLCPECATPFRRHEIERETYRRWAEELARRQVSPDLLLVVMAVCVVPALFSVLSISPRRPDPLELWSVIVWLGTLYWAWSGRWVIFRPSLPRLCWIIVPTVLAAVPFLSGRPAGWLEPVLSAIGIAAVLIVWSLTPPRRVWIPLALVSLLLLAPATACVCVGGARHLHGLTWSHVADIRDGQIHRQYPLRNDELMKVGAVGTVPGLLLACMAFAAALMTRRDAASKTG